ncbi:ribonuclease Z [Flavobacterium pallidum]|uniref:Ribonuclease Z n=1 Tax=Flavobacterium pallidum TaxID=2172098 RepID=A0A2S1SKM8_9FLAO|nr:ribonuclease Z [Flavobacterium pallidum]AWI26939.1 ribonuclease Z [Flavobacterium pallidum]
MKLTILGCYAATPRTFTNPTSQVLEIRNHHFLIDCAEATQVQLRKNKIKFTQISHIFISHLHGDHFYGLIGLISSFTLLNRTNDLHVYGPKGIKEIILLQLRYANSYTGYQLFFHELESRESEVVFEDDKVIVSTIPLKHRVYTNGYLFREKPAERKLDSNAVREHKIEICYFQNIKNGKDIKLDDGTVIPNEKLSFDPPAPKSYAFCSDTVYTESYLDIIKDVDVLYHESTFLETEAHLSERTMHCTAKQAAEIALKAHAKQLILGHFSTRYDSIESFREEAQTIFPATDLADDGKVFEF